MKIPLLFFFLNLEFRIQNSQTVSIKLPTFTGPLTVA